MFEITFFALVEELMKLGIVSVLKNTLFRIPSYFLFFAAECLMKWPEVYTHTQMLGASAIFAVLGSISVVVGSSLFHVYTSILYAHVRYVWPALAFCTILHAGWNYQIEFLPAFQLLWYVVGPWSEAIASAALILAYWQLQRRLHIA